MKTAAAVEKTVGAAGSARKDQAAVAGRVQETVLAIVPARMAASFAEVDSLAEQMAASFAEADSFAERMGFVDRKGVARDTAVDSRKLVDLDSSEVGERSGKALAALVARVARMVVRDRIDRRMAVEAVLDSLAAAEIEKHKQADIAHSQAVPDLALSGLLAALLSDWEPEAVVYFEDQIASQV